jgi:mono/diheme cytochrome c family protein
VEHFSARVKGADGAPQPIRIARPPRLDSPPVEKEITELFDALIWPGKPGTEGMWPRELDEAERARFERGRTIFEQTCASCHQLSGLGDIGIAPPLRNSSYVLGSPERLAKVVLHGLRGPLSFEGLTWDGEMPAFAASDEDIASVLTYLRREWNHTADPIAPELVSAVRCATRDARESVERGRDRREVSSRSLGARSWRRFSRIDRLLCQSPSSAESWICARSQLGDGARRDAPQSRA